mgnify:CR=1 FL=1
MSSTMPFFSPLPDPILKALPKCNIHTHLEGSVRPSTFREIAKLHGLDVELASRAVAESMQVTGAERNLVDYLQKIEFGYQVFLGGQEVQRIAYEAAEDAALDGVIYLELEGRRTNLKSLVLLGFYLRYLNLFFEDYWFDEMATFWSADPNISLSDTFSRIEFIKGTPPLFFLLLKYLEIFCQQ